MNKPTYYREATKWLDDHFPFFLTNVVNIGNPVEVDIIPRAAVALRDGENYNGDFELQLNDGYCSGLPTPQLAGVLCHEAMHILLRHFREIPQYDNQQALMLAQECIVNDKLTREGIPLPTDLYFGIETLGVDTADMTTAEAYQLALEKIQEQPEMQDLAGALAQEFFGMTEDIADDMLVSIIGQSMDMDTAKTMSQGLLDDIIDALDGAADDDELTAVSDAVDKALDELKSVDIPTASKKAGTGFATVESLAEDLGSSIAWVKLLADICPDILVKKGRINSRQHPSWHRPRRAITSMYPKVLLPTQVYHGDRDDRNEEGNRKPRLVLALDFSGSINRSNLKLMKSLAMSVPDNIQVDCCTFSTRYVPYDHKSEKNRTASGGTDFSAVEDFVRSVQEGNKYPSAVVVITDGYADFYGHSPGADMDKWLWLTFSQSEANALKSKSWLKNKGSVKLLNQYVEKSRVGV